MYKLRGHIGGEARAPVVVVKQRISFYGEVREGRLVDGRVIAGRILVAKGTRGSTVAPYILYGLKKRGLAPLGIVVSKVEPMIVAGCVMSSIPLASGIPVDTLEELRDGCEAVLVVNPPQGELVIRC